MEEKTKKEKKKKRETPDRETRVDPRPGRCVVSLSKRNLLPKSTGNTQEYVALSQHD